MRGRTIFEGRTVASQGIREGGMMVDGREREAHGNRWVEAKVKRAGQS
jgi:hypothetical protein